MNQKTALIVLIVILLLGVGGYFAFARTATAPATPATTTTTDTSASANNPSDTGTGVTSTTTTTTTTITHPVPPSTSSFVMITPDANNKTVTLKKGQRFGIAMGDALQWTLNLDPSGIVTRVPNISTIRGEQGVYTATSAGTTTLHATGTPVCEAGQACSQLMQSVTVTIVVK